MLSSFHQETRGRSKFMYSTVPFPNLLPPTCFGIQNFRGFLTGDTMCIHHVFCDTPKEGRETAHRRLGQLTVIKHVLFLQWNLQIHKIKHNSSQQLSWKKLTCAKHKRKTFSFQSNFDVRIVDKDGWSYETVPITPLLDVCAKGSWSPLYPALISLWCFGERKIILKGLP